MQRLLTLAAVCEHTVHLARAKVNDCKGANEADSFATCSRNVKIPILINNTWMQSSTWSFSLTVFSTFIFSFQNIHHIFPGYRSPAGVQDLSSSNVAPGCQAAGCAEWSQGCRWPEMGNCAGIRGDWGPNWNESISQRLQPR